MVGIAIMDWVVVKMRSRNKSSATNIRIYLQEGVHLDRCCLAASQPETLTRVAVAALDHFKVLTLALSLATDLTTSSNQKIQVTKLSNL